MFFCLFLYSGVLWRLWWRQFLSWSFLVRQLLPWIFRWALLLVRAGGLDHRRLISSVLLCLGCILCLMIFLIARWPNGLWKKILSWLYEIECTRLVRQIWFVSWLFLIVMVCVQCNISSLDFGYIVSAAITAVCGMSFGVDRCTRITSLSIVRYRTCLATRALAPEFCDSWSCSQCHVSKSEWRQYFYPSHFEF